MSPRLLLHSTCLSYVFLGAAFFLLQRPRFGPPTVRQDAKRYTPLLLLFVLWVNVDSWFLLGPMLAALFWLGELVLPSRDAVAASPRTPAWLWLAGLAVCLINPHHIHAFALPMDLTPLSIELRHDVRFSGPLASPWQMRLLYHPIAGLNLAAATYFALLALGLLSFLLNARNPIGWRLLIWCTFAGLSAWLARAIPFFAVVAAPITALNFQDFLSRRATADVPEGRSWRLGRLVVFVAGLALLPLAWIGWLHDFRDNGRGVDWAVRPDSSLHHVAETLHRWHKSGKLGDGDRGFAFHPNVVHYCAWFCPEEKGFLDHRLPLFRAVAGDFEEVCRALNPALGSAEEKSTYKWQTILRDRGVTHLILYDPDLSRLVPAVKRLATDERDWTLLHLDGRALIVGWHDGGRTLPKSVPPFDAERLAFTPPQSEDKSALQAAPDRGPGRSPRAADFQSHFGAPIQPPSWETDAANVLLPYFEARALGQQRQRATRCFGWAAAVPAVPALSGGPFDTSLRLLTQLDRMPLALGDLGQQPPALPLLAIRAARAALADNPDDAAAYLCLGQAYFVLARLTPERVVLGSFPALARLRQIQIAVALENALLRKPDLTSAHEGLANLYEASNFLDAALDHRRESLRLTRRNGPFPGESAEAFDSRIKQLETGTRELERNVGDRRNRYALQAKQLGAEPYRKAQVALGLGLARFALDDVLMQSQMVLLGGEGIRLQVELQLMLGRIEPARGALDDPDWLANKWSLGYLELPLPMDSSPARSVVMPAYDWLLLCQSAADGDYDRADRTLQATIDDLGGQDNVESMVKLRREMPRVLAREVALSSDQYLSLPRRMVHTNRALMLHLIRNRSISTIEQAELRVLGGMLSLEHGQPRQAEESFRTALELSRISSGIGRDSAGQPLAKEYLRILQAARR